MQDRSDTAVTLLLVRCCGVRGLHRLHRWRKEAGFAHELERAPESSGCGGIPRYPPTAMSYLKVGYQCDDNKRGWVPPKSTSCCIDHNSKLCILAVMAQTEKNTVSRLGYPTSSFPGTKDQGAQFESDGSLQLAWVTCDSLVGL